jgi:hypothetical protein
MAIPTKDALLVPYSLNFSTRATATPAAFQISVADESALMNLQQVYSDAYAALVAARDSGTRSQSLTATKDVAKAAMLVLLRKLYTQVQVNPAVTEANKVLIGVHIKKTNPSPKPAPIARPGMDVVSVFGRTITLNIHDSASSTKRAKAPNTTQAFVYTFVGTSYPSDPSLWQFNGFATTNKHEITLPDSVPAGAQIWICAAWANQRGIGPTSLPISTNIQGGGVEEVEAAMKIAA